MVFSYWSFTDKILSTILLAILQPSSELFDVKITIRIKVINFISHPKDTGNMYLIYFLYVVKKSKFGSNVLLKIYESMCVCVFIIKYLHNYYIEQFSVTSYELVHTHITIL